MSAALLLVGGLFAGWVLRGVREYRAYARQQREVAVAVAIVVAWADRCVIAGLIGESRIEIEPAEIEALGAALESLL